MSNFNNHHQQLTGSIFFCAFATILGLVSFKRRTEKKNYEKYTAPNLEYAIYEGIKKDDRRTVLITGGNGFLGNYIVNLLIEKGLNVIVFDIVLPTLDRRHPSVTYIRGNLLNRDHIRNALTQNSFGQVDSIIHTASLIPFLGVPEKAIWDVNVTGASLLVEEASLHGVKSYIYTSSATVLLDKNERNARKLKDDISPPKKHLDTYTTTKFAAERKTLEFNGKNGLATCVLRPAAIFGVGDRMVSDVHVKGSDRVIIGSGQVLIDWTPVESVASAHILAEEALSNQPSARKRVGGNAYNIGNEEEHTYGWFNGENSKGEQPGLSHWQHPYPSHLPVPLITGLSYLNAVVYKSLSIQMLSAYLTPSIIDYTQRSYTFSSEKARQDFGYVPVMSVEKAIANIVRRYRENQTQT